MSGVIHLGQIQTGFRYAKRIAQVHSMKIINLFNLKINIFQGGHVKIHLTNEVPVQIDGEPWVQGPGELVILKSALKVCNIALDYNK